MKDSAIAFKRKIKEISQSTSLTGRQLLIEAIKHIVFFTCSLFTATVTVTGKYMPFGISVAAGCPYIYMPSASLGAIIGSLFPLTEQSGFRYIAAIIAIMAIRLLTYKIKFTRDNPLFASFISVLTVFFTGVAVLKGLSGGVFFSFIEAILSAGGAYFIHTGAKRILSNDTGLSSSQLTCVIITISLVLSGVSKIAPGGISIGRIIFIFVILLAARQSGAGTGAIIGVSAALSSALSSAAAPVTVILSFGGLMAGVFADIGKIAEVFGFLSAAIIGAVLGGFSADTVGILIEAALGCAIYLAVPKTVLRTLGKIFAAKVTVIRPDGLKKALTMRLTFAGQALNDVSATVENVSSQLSKINSPNFKTVLTRIENEACNGCSLRVHCWEAKHNETLEGVLAITKAVRSGQSPERFLDEEFRCRCIRLTKMCTCVYKHYSEYAAAISAEKRIDEVRSVVTDQFSGISSMLCSLAKEFEADERYDTLAAARIAGALKNIDIVVSECGVKLDKNDRMTIDISIKNASNIVLNRADIMQVLCIACDRDFDPPCITHSGNTAYITVSEHAVLTADIGVFQLGSQGNVICGDAYDYFFDGKGRLILILSDGMGTGGRAAVDGAMASGLMSRLLKAGFDFDAGLKILNSAMLFKSTDESLATVDVTSVDLFTGKTSLLKAGAAPTIVRRNGRAAKAQSTSLPAGILRDIAFDRAAITLKTEDIILMMSDGAVTEGTDWITAELESWGDSSAQALAERIAKCAKRRRTDKKQDDITVMAAIIKKS
ncbi:MAG: SpoIIE family protein phosphatase [Acutalibacteraceae bacterium]|nr:SpoIIE family protein phosphatase [Acutalibacteraceae bacterium]